MAELGFQLTETYPQFQPRHLCRRCYAFVPSPLNTCSQTSKVSCLSLHTLFCFSVSSSREGTTIHPS